MIRIDGHKVTTVLLTLALAGPPLWWAGEALATARTAADAETIITAAAIRLSTDLPRTAAAVRPESADFLTAGPAPGAALTGLSPK